MQPKIITSAGVPRRRLLAASGAVAAGLATLELCERVGLGTERPAFAADGDRNPDIQFDIRGTLPPLKTVGGIMIGTPPTYTVFVTGRLSALPAKADQQAFTDALAAISQAYPFGLQGIYPTVSYGLPYFARLPAGLVAQHMPKLTADPTRPVLEEAVPSPTDVHSSNPNIRKRFFQNAVKIDGDDLLLTMRSDDPAALRDVITWLMGSGQLKGKTTALPKLQTRLSFTTCRVMFHKIGAPRMMADAAKLKYASLINPDSPMWMGFSDQQADASATPPQVTFVGADGIKFTNAKAGDYFDNGAIQHLSHVILDLDLFYGTEKLTAAPGAGGQTPGQAAVPSLPAPIVPNAGGGQAAAPAADPNNPTTPYLERVQLMFRSTPPPSQGAADQYTNGGGPATVTSAFKGLDDAVKSAKGEGTPEGRHRVGHVNALQRSSRNAQGKALHVRVDGPGFDQLDVANGNKQPKLHFSIFVPSADLFATMRRHQAAQDLTTANQVPEAFNGLERYTTATRRQNFLAPGTKHRAFPLVELT